MPVTLQWVRGDKGITVKLFVPIDALERANQDPFGAALLRECGLDTSSIADKLLGLEFVARKELDKQLNL